MGNTPSWLDRWKRSPRQDRRVVVDGKFVEQTAPILPTPEPEEVNTALEVVQEAIDAKQAPLSPKEIDELALQLVVDEQVEKAATEFGFKGAANEPTERKVFANPLLAAPYDLSAATVTGGLQAYADRMGGELNGQSESEKLQAELEPLPSVPAAAIEAANVLLAVGENISGASVLDGSVGRIEETGETVTTIEHREDGSNTVIHTHE